MTPIIDLHQSRVRWPHECGVAGHPTGKSIVCPTSERRPSPPQHGRLVKHFLRLALLPHPTAINPDQMHLMQRCSLHVSVQKSIFPDRQWWRDCALASASDVDDDAPVSYRTIRGHILCINIYIRCRLSSSASSELQSIFCPHIRKKYVWYLRISEWIVPPKSLHIAYWIWNMKMLPSFWYMRNCVWCGIHVLCLAVLHASSACHTKWNAAHHVLWVWWKEASIIIIYVCAMHEKNKQTSISNVQLNAPKMRKL